MRYNRRKSFRRHFNCLRSYALGDESALLMASYPRGRPANPFPYFTEVMTGFEYTAAVGMLYEGQVQSGLRCIRDVRARYDGRKRNPFNEAECGHHYARAMASWAAVPALSGFSYSGVEKSISFKRRAGQCFWSNGYAWGVCRQQAGRDETRVSLSILGGRLALRSFGLLDFGRVEWPCSRELAAGDTLKLLVRRAGGAEQPPGRAAKS